MTIQILTMIAVWCGTQFSAPPQTRRTIQQINECRARIVACIGKGSMSSPSNSVIIECVTSEKL